MKMMKKIVLALIAGLMCWSVAHAVPAKPLPFTHIQSDGSAVTVMMQGGEFNHSLVTLDGLTVARDMKGDYCYSVNGALSDILAHDKGHRTLEEQAFLAAYRNDVTLVGQSCRGPRRTDENEHPQVPTIGSPRIPVILVNYTDVKFIDEDPAVTFQNQFNEMEYSCLNYFESQSRGKFSPVFDILGPVDLPMDRAFYGANVRVYGTEVDAQLGTMIYDACTGLPDVDFSDYDNDGDGYVDVVVVLFAGVGEAQAWRNVPESVWPCQWDMQESYEWGCSSTGPFMLNGVTIDKYAVFNELEGNSNTSTNIDGVGTFCHEFSHCLGLPDFYHTGGGSVFGMSTWDIMDHGCYLNNGYTPAGYTSYERHFMGWMELIDPVENTRYFMAPLNTPKGTAVKVVNDANPDEYYLLEYRTKTDWDEYIPGEGILILHVDYDKTAWDNNTPNNIGSHQRMTIIPADNVWTGYSNSTDVWPLGEKDSLTNNSTPAAVVFTGQYMNKPITGMSVDKENGTASFWFMKKDIQIVGDVNGDGEVTIADVNTLVNAVLEETPEGEIYKRADVDGDGEVTIADVNVLINLILNN